MSATPTKRASSSDERVSKLMSSVHVSDSIALAKTTNYIRSTPNKCYKTQFLPDSTKLTPNLFCLQTQEMLLLIVGSEKHESKTIRPNYSIR